jgi:hypothetical protein
MVIACAVLLVIFVLLLALLIREQDLPQLPPPDPFHVHDERKARIYENLRDLQFELRIGKLSDEDYAKSKAVLQAELARVLADIDALKAELAGKPKQEEKVAAK